jgi:hypothetical protein
MPGRREFGKNVFDSGARPTWPGQCFRSTTRLWHFGIAGRRHEPMAKVFRRRYHWVPCEFDGSTKECRRAFGTTIGELA